MSVFRFILLLCVAVISTQSNASHLDKVGWLAFGDMRGYVEPCGCDPNADLGGIQRAAVLLQRERALNPELFLFSLGNNLPIDPKNELHKVPILLSALAALKPTAALFGRLESKGYVLDPEKFHGVNYVASNLTSPSKYKYVKPSVEVKGIFVTGFVEPRDAESEISFRRFSPAILQQWKKSAIPGNEKVLLYDGSEALLEKIFEAGIFDLIVAGNTREFGKAVGPEEKANPRLLNRLNGKVRSVPIGGQGYLRGGILLQQKAESLQKLLGKQICQPGGEGLTGICSGPEGSSRSQIQPTETVTWLDRTYAVPSPLDELYNSYQKAGAEVFAENANRRANDLANSPFAGSFACKSCHPQEYEVWSESRHAHALDTLTNVSKDKDPECVSCHVLGYNAKGGFANKELSPQFAHVNCENCHGPRKEHASQPGKVHSWKGKAAEVCTNCHHGTHTSNFQFNDYWPKIKHGSKSLQRAP